ncbi:MAG TPA: hypothetical protein VGQ65_21605 [Thermoanaerobaculia bacterium]|nr:hypothetical protein [Thermoanaerobaculia bacterium]
MRERLVKVKDAPGRSFDHGEFEIVVESVPARAEDGTAANPLRLCRACRRFVLVDDRDDCTFCGTDLDAADAKHQENVAEMRLAGQALREALAERG